MDFDPGFHEEMYDEHLQEDMEPPEDEIEFDDLGNPTYLAVATSFGYEMAQEEIDERQLAEDILKDRSRKERKQNPVKIPLSDRHKTKGYMTPFARWATKVNINPKNTSDEIEYTLEEQLQIIRAEGEGHD